MTVGTYVRNFQLLVYPNQNKHKNRLIGFRIPRL
jgi:hypothetical protein